MHIQRVYRGWAAREGENGVFCDFAARARASAAAARMQAAARRWLVTHRVTLPSVLFDNNEHTSHIMSASVANCVPIDVAARHYVHGLVTRKIALFGHFVNAGTVRSFLKDDMLKFASYKRHRLDTHLVPFYHNYVWIKAAETIGTEYPMIGRRRGPTETELRDRDAAKNARRANQPGFVTRDILSVVARYLPVTDWASLVRMCAGAAFCLPRSTLRKECRARFGYSPKDPLAAMLAYNMARGKTPWRCTKTVVFAWSRPWATQARHGSFDHVLHMWATPEGSMHFITTYGKCGTFRNEPKMVVAVSNMMRNGQRFFVQHVSIGHDGCICLVHTMGLTIYRNIGGKIVVHVPYTPVGTHEVACFDERHAFVVHGASKRLYSLCTACPEPHLVRVASRQPIVVGCRQLKATITGAVWRASSLRLCCLSSERPRATEISPRMRGRGRILYISDMLPCRTNAVLYATGPLVTNVVLTDGCRVLRNIDLAQRGVPLTPMLRQPFSTVGDMVVYRDQESREVMAVRPRTDAKIVPARLPIMQVDNPSVRCKARHRRDMYLFNDAVFVAEQGGRRIVRYTAQPGL